MLASQVPRVERSIDLVETQAASESGSYLTLISPISQKPWVRVLGEPDLYYSTIPDRSLWTVTRTSSGLVDFIIFIR
jgi:hypothetical protein